MLSRSYVTSPTAHNLTNPTPLWSKAFDEMCGVESSVTLGQVFTHPVLCCIDGVPYRSEICPSYTDNELARLAACGLAAREVVQVHIHLSADFHRLCRVPPEATADGIGNNPKPLTELIDETQGELAVADGRSDKESSGDLGK